MADYAKLRRAALGAPPCYAMWHPSRPMPPFGLHEELPNATGGCARVVCVHPKSKNCALGSADPTSGPTLLDLTNTPLNTIIYCDQSSPVIIDAAPRCRGVRDVVFVPYGGAPARPPSVVAGPCCAAGIVRDMNISFRYAASVCAFTEDDINRIAGTIGAFMALRPRRVIAVLPLPGLVRRTLTPTTPQPLVDMFARFVNTAALGNGVVVEDEVNVVVNVISDDGTSDATTRRIHGGRLTVLRGTGPAVARFIQQGGGGGRRA